MFPFDSVFSATNTSNSDELLDSSGKILCWKARLENFEDVESIIFEYMECLGTLVEFEDTYFNTPKGLLKLRMTRNSRNGQLIYTVPDDVTLPGLRASSSADVENCDPLKDTLSLALGVIGTIQNKRRVFVKDNIRICLDFVEQLGQFVSASAKLDDNVENCVRNLQSIQAKLHIDHSELTHSSYLDLLMPLAPADVDDNDNDDNNDNELIKRASASSSTDESGSDQQSLSSESLVS